MARMVRWVVREAAVVVVVVAAAAVLVEDIVEEVAKVSVC